MKIFISVNEMPQSVYCYQLLRDERYIRPKTDGGLLTYDANMNQMRDLSPENATQVQ